jgi:hypothetical protein
MVEGGCHSLRQKINQSHLMKDAAGQLEVISTMAGADLPGILSYLSLLEPGIKV